MDKSKKRTISFFMLFALSEGRRADVMAPNWAAQFRALGARSIEDLTLDEIVFVPEVLNGERPVLSMHKPLDTAFMTQIDKTHRVSDFLGQDIDDPQVANSTAAAFLPGLPIVALGQGGQRTCPSITDVVRFLDKVMPLENGGHWKYAPALDPAKLARFRAEAKGVVSFSARYSTVKDLFTPVDDSGILALTDHVAERLRGDLIVDINMRLAPDAPNTARARFKAFLDHSLPRLVSDAKSRTRATAVLSDGVHEEMNLVAQRLSISIDLDQSTSESRRFSALRDRVVAVGAEYDDEFRSLQEG